MGEAHDMYYGGDESGEYNPLNGDPEISYYPPTGRLARLYDQWLRDGYLESEEDFRVIRRAAAKKVARALKSGKLVKEPCESCGSPDVQAHHDSYKREDWLKVRWLCWRCHYEQRLGRPWSS